MEILQLHELMFHFPHRLLYGTDSVVLCTDQVENAVSRSTSIVACVSCNRPWMPLGLRDVEAPTFSRHSPYAAAALYPQEDSWYSFLLEAELTPGS
jgi:hypothetical protein